VHMMVWQPERYFDDFAAAGASRMLIHAEATPHVHRHVHRIKELGCAAGVAINPGTPVEALVDIAPDLDTVLIMTVNPGFGGQQFIAHTVEKIARTRALLTRINSRAVLEVDGGINRETIGTCYRAGADTFVAGHAVFDAKDPRAEIGELRRRAVEQPA
jgi:ribulose-phosphate 3-epimerase